MLSKDFSQIVHVFIQLHSKIRVPKTKDLNAQSLTIASKVSPNHVFYTKQIWSAWPYNG